MTAAICADPDKIDRSYDIGSVSNLLDFVHVQSYDYNEAASGEVEPNAPLHKVITTIEHLKARQVPLAKIVMGLPFYGRTFIKHADGTVDRVGFKGPYLENDTHMAYNEICEILRQEEWELKRLDMDAQELAMQRIPGSTDKKVIVYDSPTFISAKTMYGVHKGLGGFMVWSLDMDDFRNGYPLMNVVNDQVK